MKGKKLLILSLILALIAAGLAFRYLSELDERSKQAANLVPVLTAKAEIPAKTKLDETMFTFINVPRNSLHADAITQREEIKGAFTQDRIVAGEQVLRTRLVFSESKTGLSYKVSEGHRALTVSVGTVSGVAGYILPGDRVDVVATIDLTDGDEDITLTAVVAENIMVLAVGQYTADQKKEQLPVDSATLDVPNEYVTALIQATERGSVRLVLRPVVDESKVAVPAHLMKQFVPKK
jgi:pilus assembly protein CpaB